MEKSLRLLFGGWFFDWAVTMIIESCDQWISLSRSKKSTQSHPQGYIHYTTITPTIGGI
jgi:hypothetical protein